MFFLAGCSEIDGLDTAISNMGLGSLAGYDVVYKQNFGNVCCEKENVWDGAEHKTLNNKDTFYCDDYTDECKIQITNIDSGSWTIDNLGWYSICTPGYNCASNQYYQVSVGQSKDFTIQKGQYVVFKTGATVQGEQDTKISKYVKRFYIKGVENGDVFTQESCVLNSQLRKLTGTAGLNELAKTGSNRCQSYMIDFVSVATKTYTYNNQEVICQARQLYDIEEQKFKDGQTRKLQGNRLASVECCPSEANCNAGSFTFDINVIKDCSYDSECPNAGNPIAVASDKYLTYDCISGECKASQQQTVECTTSAHCVLTRGAGYVCDFAPATWGTCKRATGSGYCGDGVCESVNSENIDTCPADCMGSTAWWVYLLIGIGAVLLFGFLRPSLKRLPYVGKFIP